MRSRRTSGVALIAVLMIVTVVAVLVFATSLTSLIDRRVSANQRGSLDAYQVAQQGADRFKTIGFQTYRYYLENIDLYRDELTSGAAACGNVLNIGLDMDRDGALDGANDFGPNGSTGWISDGIERGEYRVTLAADGPYYIVTSEGQINRSRATVRYVLQPINIGVFNYAIFAGAGGVGNRKLNGNAQIFGGVYAEGTEGATVIDSNGSFELNNYYTLDQLEDLIRWSDRNTSAEEFLNLKVHDQTDLCARLRIPNGQIELSGSMEIGDPEAETPEGFKGTVEGVYVADYPDDGSIIESGSADLHADEVGGFNGDSEPMPGLDERVECTDGSTSVWRNCLRQDAALEVSAGSPPTVATSLPGATISPSCETTLAAASTGNELSFGATSIDCTVTDSAGNQIGGFLYSFDSGTNKGELVIYGDEDTIDEGGIVAFSGMDLHFERNVDVRFRGAASLFVESDGANGGNVQVDGDILPDTAFGVDGTFPDESILGIIAEKRFHVTGRNQNRLDTSGQAVAGLFFAGERAVVEGGTVFGTVVSPQFCTAENNASPPECQAGGSAAVVHTPGIEYNLAPGFDLIPNAAQPSFRVVSYERIDRQP